jgi:hypothetical protein
LTSVSSLKTKRRALGEETHSTPIKRKRTETKANTALTMGVGATNDEIKTFESLKWLYISSLDPQTSGEAVVQLISSDLQSASTEFACVKLLPKNVLDPTFVSFKIRMKEDLFLKNLTSSLVEWHSFPRILVIINEILQTPLFQRSRTNSFFD